MKALWGEKAKEPTGVPVLSSLLPPVDLLNRNVEALGNIFHSLAGG